MINVLIWVTKRIRKFMTKNNMIENPLSDDDKLLLKLLSKNEIKKLDHWRVQKIFNHRKKEVGKIIANLL